MCVCDMRTGTHYPLELLLYLHAQYDHMCHYNYICVLILLYMCPHTAVDVSSYWYMCPHTAVDVSSYCYICVRILPDMCPHAALYVSSYCYIYVLILLHVCPHTAIYVSSHCYIGRAGGECDDPRRLLRGDICVLILLYRRRGW